MTKKLSDFSFVAKVGCLFSLLVAAAYLQTEHDSNQQFTVGGSSSAPTIQSEQPSNEIDANTLIRTVQYRPEKVNSSVVGKK